MLTAEEPKVRLDEKYSIEQASKLIGLSSRQINRLVNAGSIKCGYRLYSKRRFLTGREILRFWKTN